MPSDDALEKELFEDMKDTPGDAGRTGGLPSLNREDVRRLSWDRFEALAAVILERQGATAILTPRSGDEGVDVIGIRGNTIDLVQCKHTLWDAAVDADVVAELIQSFDGYRARRFRSCHGRSTLRPTLFTNGRLTAQARRNAKERDVRVCEGEDLLRLLNEHVCSASDIESAGTRRLASMRDVQAKIDAVIGVSVN